MFCCSKICKSALHLYCKHKRRRVRAAIKLLPYLFSSSSPLPSPRPLFPPSLPQRLLWRQRSRLGSKRIGSQSKRRRSTQRPWINCSGRAKAPPSPRSHNNVCVTHENPFHSSRTCTLYTADEKRPDHWFHKERTLKRLEEERRKARDDMVPACMFRVFMVLLAAQEEELQARLAKPVSAPMPVEKPAQAPTPAVKPLMPEVVVKPVIAEAPAVAVLAPVAASAPPGLAKPAASSVAPVALPPASRPALNTTPSPAPVQVLLQCISTPTLSVRGV